MRAVHPFPARMAPDAVTKWLHQLKEGARVLDPMCGSGVVLRQSIQMGHEAIGYDIDPLAVLMSRVWTRNRKHIDLIGAANEVVHIASARQEGYLDLPWVASCAETKQFIEYWFAEPQRSQLARLVLTIQEMKLSQPEWLIDALYLSISKTIVTKIAGASLAWDVSHSRPHKKRESNDYNVSSGFFRSAERLVSSLDEINLTHSAQVNNGDCRSMPDVVDQSVDAVVTSPPYLNALDYLRGHKLSLVWMGYTIPELRGVRATSVGTERTRQGLATPENTTDVLAATVSEIAQLPKRQQAIVHRYAQDAALMLVEAKRVLTPNGRLVLVLADSVVRGVEVSSSSIFGELAQRDGFKLIEKKLREIPHNRRYLPINSRNVALRNRMRSEIIQVFERAS